NAEIDVIWEKWEAKLKPTREQLTLKIGQDEQDLQDGKKGKRSKSSKQPEHPVNPGSTLPEHPGNPVQVLEEWQIPREFPEEWPSSAVALHAEFWKLRIARQKEIDASIAAKADFEFLYDKPYEDKKKVRVAGPFTVESLSPHRMLGVDENDDLIDPLKQLSSGNQTFEQMVLDHLRVAGVQQAHKADKISFTSLTGWPGKYICAEGIYSQASGKDEQNYHDGLKLKSNPAKPVDPVRRNVSQRAAIFIGPEFGTVQRQDLVAAAREAGDGQFDVLIGCAFHFEAHTTEFNSLGRVPVLKARMNADLHMSEELKNTGKGNLFVIFGEPDIDLIKEKNGQLRVKVNGVDVFKPQSGEVVSDNADGIACWFID
ncbi:MAG: site-specific DNA-methyltransferase, partial [Gemmataceae bacterium]